MYSKTYFTLVIIFASFRSGAQWVQVGQFNQFINDLQTFDGKLFVGGSFTQFEGNTCY
jgi:hypothetical protein